MQLGEPFIEEVAQRYPYPLAKRFLAYFCTKPEGFQSHLYTERFIHDAIQYVCLILVAQLHQHKQPVSLLPSYELRDWIELLERLLREELLRPEQQALSKSIAAIQADWQKSLVVDKHEIFWYQVARSSSVFPSLDWQEDVCTAILVSLCNSLKPILGFFLGWLNPAEPEQLVYMTGINSDKWQRIPFANGKQKIGQLVLCGENLCLDLFPWFIIETHNSPEFLMWDGDVGKEKKIFYHSANKYRILSFHNVHEYQNVKIPRALPDSTYSGLLKRSGHHLKSFLARQSQSGRYSLLVYHPQVEIVTELKNFISSQYSRLALVLGDQGVGKTNLICYLAQQWLREGHFVSIVEASDIRENSLCNLASSIYGKNQNWNLLFKEIPSAYGKHCIIVITKLETHPEIKSLLEYISIFLQTFGSASCLSIILVGDIEILPKIQNQLDALKSFMYNPVLCTSQNSYVIEMQPLPLWAVKKLYRQYQKVYQDKLPTLPCDFDFRLNACLQYPLWLKLLTDNAENRPIPGRIRRDELLSEYVTQLYRRYPLLEQMLYSALHIFRDNWDFPLVEFQKSENRHELLEECYRLGIFQLRNDMEGVLLISFGLPALRDFLLSRYIFKDDFPQDDAKESTINCRAYAWYFFSYFQRDTQLDRFYLFKDSEAIAKALILLHEISPCDSSTEDRIFELCRAVIETRDTAPVLKLLQKLGKNQPERLFTRLLDLLCDKNRHLAVHDYLQIFEILCASAPLRHEGETLCASPPHEGKTAVTHYPDIKKYLQHDWWEIAAKEDEETQRIFAHGIAKLYYCCGDFTTALGMEQNALKVAEKQKDLANIYKSLRQISDCHYALNEFSQAQQCYNRMLQLAHELNDPSIFKAAAHSLAELYNKFGDIRATLVCYDQILEIDQDFGNILDQIKTLKLKASLHKSQSQVVEAIENYQKAYQGAWKLTDYSQMVQISSELERLFDKMGDTEQSSRYRRQASYFANQLAPCVIFQ